MKKILCLAAATLLAGASAQAAFDWGNPTYSVAVTFSDINAASTEDWSTFTPSSDTSTVDLAIDSDGTLIVSFDPSTGTGLNGAILDIDTAGSDSEIVTEADIVAQSSTAAETDWDETGLVVDSNGDLYILDTENDEMFKVTRSGGTVSKLGDVTINGFNTNLAFDGTNLYYGDTTSDQLFQMPKTGGAESVFMSTSEINTAISGTTAWASDAGPVSANGGGTDIYWFDESFFGGVEELVSVDTSKNGSTITSGGLGRIEKLAVSSSGTIAAVGHNTDDPSIHIIESNGTIHSYDYSTIGTNVSQSIDVSFGAVAIKESASEIIVYFHNSTSDDILAVTIPESTTAVGNWNLY